MMQDSQSFAGKIQFGVRATNSDNERSITAYGIVMAERLAPLLNQFVST